jgi:cysteinyl-tRNA synthetase
MLNIYNTLTRTKAPLEPIIPHQVRLYVCGMTVYDHCHLGHARVMVVFDVVVRYLRYLGYEVIYVRNITDVDDKIIQRAKENSEDIHALTQRFIDAMHEDEDALAVLRPDIEPRATQSMADIITMIQTLLDNGLAYMGDNGDVYYQVEKFAAYGALSGKKTAELLAGSRVDIETAKKNPLDFVLWKAAKPEEPHWPSPWGNGRPGWHIECSAMSTRCLGSHFDIHGGGMDLQFPHHENEIAQSEGATGHQFVNVWMHNGFVRINEEKMSKSLNNFFTVREILNHYSGETIRCFILTSHYRSPLHYSEHNLNTAQGAVNRLYTALRGLDTSDCPADLGQNFIAKFTQAMNDDFNSAEALAVLFELAHDINRYKTTNTAVACQLGGLLRQLAGVLGLLQADADRYLQGTDNNSIRDATIENLIQARQNARVQKQWAESDRIRDELKAQGIVLEDGANGTTWRREL